MHTTTLPSRRLKMTRQNAMNVSAWCFTLALYLVCVNATTNINECKAFQEAYIGLDSGEKKRDDLPITNVLELLLHKSCYNPRVRPGMDTNEALDVSVAIIITAISSIYEASMDFTISLFMQQRWTDSRLQYNHFSKRRITLDHNEFDRIWTPDLYFVNLKTGALHAITEPNRKIDLTANGTVIFEQRLTVTLSCPMVLTRYPMDNQSCPIILSSFAYNKNRVSLRWASNDSVQRAEGVGVNGFLIDSITQSTTLEEKYYVLRGNINLIRRLRPYLLITYLPSILVVMLSWLSFWIDPESTPARISLAILTILTITTQSSAQHRNAAECSVTRAIDVWMTTCLVFVFGAFIEYTIVNTLARRERINRTKKAALAAMVGSSSDRKLCDVDGDVEGHGNTNNRKTCCLSGWWKKTMRSKAVAVELLARVLFALFFITFNCVYWPLYLQNTTF